MEQPSNLPENKSHAELLIEEQRAAARLLGALYSSKPDDFALNGRAEAHVLVRGYLRLLELLPQPLRPQRREVHNPPRIPGDNPRA